MFKQFTCLSACCLFAAALVGLSDDVFAQGAEKPPSNITETQLTHHFVRDILAIHPALQSAEAALEAAKAQERSADRPLYNPDLDFDAEKASSRTYQAGISQTVDWAGKKKAAYAASGARRLATENEYQIIRNDLTTQILTLLSEYWSAVDLARLASSSVDLMRDFAQQAKSRYDAGDMTQVEYETAVLAYAEVRMRQADVAANLAGVIRELTTLGAREDVRSWPQIPLKVPALPTQPSDVDTLVADLPQVGAANALVAAADAEVDLAKRLKKPDPTFGLRVGEEDDDSLIGLSFSIPLFVRNTFNEDLQASLALRSQAKADAATIKRDAQARLLVAIERYMTMRDGWMVWEESGASSIERRSDALRKLWDAREINISEFLLQVRQTLDTRTTAFELRATVWRAWIEYLNASSQVENWLKYGNLKTVATPKKITMRQN
ncbi:MAG: TolC family protein [Chloroflexi bacterium]|nr:MAG: TolC family protein [Chloroflexota bacterium]